MTSAARLLARPGLRLAVFVAAALALLAGALSWRAPSYDPAYLPEMAVRPVLMSDGRALYVQRFEVTISEWNACFRAGACAIELRPRPGFDPATTPATGVNHADAQDYLRWITAATGHPFRLPTASEWAHMAAPVLPDVPDPLFTDPSLRWATAYLTQGLAPRALKPQGSFSTTPEGIADLDGSVWEWTQDCFTDETDQARCPAYIVGGEHESAMFYLERDPARGGCAAGTPPAHLGLRLVADHHWQGAVQDLRHVNES